MSLSIRLKEVASLVDKGSVLVDIGCDHAYLPIYLIENKICSKCYAVDNKDHPLNNAISNIKSNNLEGKIIPVLSDGFIKLNDIEFDSATICGMGSDTIKNILDGLENKNNKTFILEANNNHEVLREYLSLNGFEIVDEKIVYESNFYYQIIKCIYNGKRYKLNREELIYGPINLKKKSKELKDLINFQLKILNDAYSTRENMELKAKISFLEGVLNEIK